jgi:Mce-associated membrane protein
MDADRPADATVTRPSGAGRSFTPPRWLTAVLAGVLLALVVTGGVLGWQLRQAQALQDRRTAVLQAASEHAVTFLTVDYRHVQQDTTDVLAMAAGQFKQQYAASRGRLQQLVGQNKTVSTGKVLSAGVVSSDADSARVIVVADSEVRNLSSPQPQPRHYRLQLDLTKQGGRWLVTGLQFVG